MSTSKTSSGKNIDELVAEVSGTVQANPTPADTHSIHKLIEDLFKNLQNSSPEEVLELESLRTEHAQKIKAAKIERFKKVPGRIRQQVIDRAIWAEERTAINNVGAIDKDPRLVQLENKKRLSQGFSSGSSYGGNIPIDLSGVDFDTFAIWPEGLSLEDMKMAHLDATAEEELLGCRD